MAEILAILCVLIASRLSMLRFVHGKVPHIILVASALIILFIASIPAETASDLFLNVMRTPNYVVSFSALVLLLAMLTLPALRKRRVDFSAIYFRIPFITVLSEEIIFRAVLLGLLVQLFPTTWAVLTTSILFGLWHAYEPKDSNKPLSDIIRRRTIDITITTLAGIVFCLITIGTNTIILAFIMHWIANSIGLLLAQTSKISNSLHKVY